MPNDNDVVEFDEETQSQLSQLLQNQQQLQQLIQNTVQTWKNARDLNGEYELSMNGGQPHLIKQEESDE